MYRRPEPATLPTHPITREAPLEDPFDLSSLIAEYRDESDDQLGRLDRDLLALEQSGTLATDENTALLRALHTLKGNSGMLGLHPIVNAVHALEEVFRQPGATPPRERLDLLFEAAAAIRQAVDQAGTPQQEAAFTRLTALDLASRLESPVADASPASPTPVANDPDDPADAPPRSVPLDTDSAESAGEFLRVPFAKLDALLDQVGELTSVGAALDAVIERFEAPLKASGAGQAFAEVAEQLERVTRALRSSTMETRLVPIHRVFSRFPTLARDLAREQGKQVRLVVEGGDVELDRSMVDALGDPLLHLVRNAVHHGIATPEAREAAGRSATGTILLSAERQGDRVRIEVADDGEGLDRAALLRSARALGLVGEHESLTRGELAELIFRPGFTTRIHTDTVAGRGIGLDAVKQRVMALRGTLGVETPPEGGTRFILTFPLTLAILPALVFEAEGEMFAIPAVSVERTLRNATPERAGTTEVLRFEDELIPVTRAGRAFGWRPAADTDRGPAPFAVVIRSGARRGAVLASQLIDQRNLVVRAIPHFLGTLPAVSGASVAPDGRVILLLDPTGLFDLNLALHTREKRAFNAP